MTTLDKQGFYKRIGYTETDPVPIFGGLPGVVTESFKLLSISSENSAETVTETSGNDGKLKMPIKEGSSSSKMLQGNLDLCYSDNDRKITDKTLDYSQSSIKLEHVMPPLPPPPPPPPPAHMKAFKSVEKYNTPGAKGKLSNQSQKTFMMKFI